MYATFAAGAALILATLPASPATAQGKTALTISVREQDSPRMSASLRCNPTSGTHPKKDDACVEIASSGGDLEKLPGRQTFAACAKIFLPVSVRADGLAEGKPVAYKKTFPNRCELGVATGSVFELFTEP
ncbi:MAG: SSI family serine proteinase inhibitor [Sporichthyaceae bacterium]